MIPSNTPEWVKARVGCLGASMMPTVMLPPNRDGTEKAAKIALLKDMVAERLVGYAKDHYVTPAMQWGLQWEAEAKLKYEAVSGNLLADAGWIEHPLLEFAGATPDALIDSDGVLEVKCPTTATHMDWRLAGVVPEEYRPQMAFQLLCTRRRYAHFISFDPRVTPDLQVFVRSFTPTAQYLAEIESAAVKFLKAAEALFVAMTQTVSIEI